MTTDKQPEDTTPDPVTDQDAAIRFNLEMIANRTPPGVGAEEMFSTEQIERFPDLRGDIFLTYHTDTGMLITDEDSGKDMTSLRLGCNEDNLYRITPILPNGSTVMRQYGQGFSDDGRRVKSRGEMTTGFSDDFGSMPGDRIIEMTIRELNVQRLEDKSKVDEPEYHQP